MIKFNEQMGWGETGDNYEIIAAEEMGRLCYDRAETMGVELKPLINNDEVSMEVMVVLRSAIISIAGDAKRLSERQDSLEAFELNTILIDLVGLAKSAFDEEYQGPHLDEEV